ncbi:MAG TPA: hypothetical protein VK446_04130, partial [Methylocystis sp.]|nr:hypothetical protein [Methylocystis sp.]
HEESRRNRRQIAGGGRQPQGWIGPAEKLPLVRSDAICDRLIDQGFVLETFATDESNRRRIKFELDLLRAVLRLLTHDPVRFGWRRRSDQDGIGESQHTHERGRALASSRLS